MTKSAFPARVAVIGAGVAGLACARTLSGVGHRVVVFDKGRRPGGRLNTRRTERGRFDHGAQFFTVRDPRFGRRVERWRERGIVDEWRGRVVRLHADGSFEPAADERRLVGVPGMRAIADHLAADLQVRLESRVEGLEAITDGWRVVGTGGAQLGWFDIVLITIPAPQTTALLPAQTPLVKSARAAAMRPCWAVLCEFERALPTPYDAAIVERGALSWIARDGSKPGRQPGERWVLHASPAWSQEHLERPADWVAGALTEALAGVVRLPLPPLTALAHRWRYARPHQPLDASSLYDPSTRLGIGGDWCRGAQVEDAFLSGVSLAGRVLDDPRFSAREQPMRSGGSSGIA